MAAPIIFNSSDHVVLFCCDFDGTCDTPDHQEVIKAKILKLIEECFKVIFFNISNRSYLKYDLYNLLRNQNGSPYCIFPVFIDDIKEQLSPEAAGRLIYSRLTFADIVNDCEAGAHAAAIEQFYEDFDDEVEMLEQEYDPAGTKKNVMEFVEEFFARPEVELKLKKYFIDARLQYEGIFDSSKFFSLICLLNYAAFYYGLSACKAIVVDDLPILFGGWQNYQLYPKLFSKAIQEIKFLQHVSYTSSTSELVRPDIFGDVNKLCGENETSDFLRIGKHILNQIKNLAQGYYADLTNLFFVKWGTADKYSTDLFSLSMQGHSLIDNILSLYNLCQKVPDLLKVSAFGSSTLLEKIGLDDTEGFNCSSKLLVADVTFNVVPQGASFVKQDAGLFEEINLVRKLSEFTQIILHPRFTFTIDDPTITAIIVGYKYGKDGVWCETAMEKAGGIWQASDCLKVEELPVEIHYKFLVTRVGGRQSWENGPGTKQKTSDEFTNTIGESEVISCKIAIAPEFFPLESTPTSIVAALTAKELGSIFAEAKMLQIDVDAVIPIFRIK